ncbi:MAG: flagellar export protein FliJ [Acidihalobacter sp.]
MTRAKRLEPVKEIAAREERAAARQLNELQRRVNEARERLVELQAWDGEYAEDRAQGSFNLAELQGLREFMLRLGDAIEQQRMVVLEAEAALALGREAWLATHTRHTALTQVIEQYRRDAERQEQRREQQQSDEFAARHHAGNKGE